MPKNQQNNNNHEQNKKKKQEDAYNAINEAKQQLDVHSTNAAISLTREAEQRQQILNQLIRIDKDAAKIPLQPNIHDWMFEGLTPEQADIVNNNLYKNSRPRNRAAFLIDTYHQQLNAFLEKSSAWSKVVTPETITMFNSPQIKEASLKGDNRLLVEVFTKDFRELTRINPDFISKVAKAGKFFTVISAGAVSYEIAMSNSKVETAVHEGTILMTGFGGGYVGGMLGGLAAAATCGPGAPVCAGVIVGSYGLIGGIVFSQAGEYYWQAVKFLRESNINKNNSNKPKPQTSLIKLLSSSAHAANLPVYRHSQVHVQAPKQRPFHPSTTTSSQKNSSVIDYAKARKNELLTKVLTEKPVSNDNPPLLKHHPITTTQQQNDNALVAYKQARKEERMKEVYAATVTQSKPAGTTTKLVVLNNKVQEKYQALLQASKPERAKQLEDIFNNRLATNYSMIQQIKDRCQDNKQKILELVGTVRGFYDDVQQPKGEDPAAQQANMLATFQTAMYGFNTIAEVGRRLNNRPIQTIGTVGAAASQVALGLAQFGTFGGAAVTELAMVPAAGAVVSGVILLSSLFMRRGKGGSLQKSLRAMQEQLSEQIAIGFNRVLEGIGIVINNQKFTIELIEQGFKQIDEKLFIVINQNDRIETKVDEINQKIDDVIATLQKLGMQLDAKELEDLILTAELLVDGNGIKDRTTFDTKINKTLKRIATQLNFSLTENSRKLSDKGNYLPGWFHILDFADLLYRKEFSQFNFDLRKVVNLIWWENVLECYYLLLPRLNPEDDLSKKYQKQILTILQETAEPTKQFIQKIASHDFIQTFLNHYKKRFDAIRNSAEEILSAIRNAYSKAAMTAFATRCIAMNLGAHLSAENWQSLIQEINKNTNEKVRACNNFHSLPLHAKEYQVLLEGFQFYSHILFSLLGIHQDISSLRIVNMDCYKHYISRQLNVQIHGHTVTLHYLEGPTDNLFASFDFSNDIRVDVQPHIDRLDSIDYYSALSLKLEKNPMPPQLAIENKTQKLQLNLSGNKTMKKDIDIKEIIKSIQPVLDIVKSAQDLAIVPVVGKTGSGKSTLLNYLYGSEYKEVINEDNGEEFLEFVDISKAEIFPVGHGVSSATLLPKLGKAKSNKDVKYTYCDTGGYFDNRGDNERICIGSVLQILKQALTLEKPIQGLVLVINYGKIDERGNPLFDILSTFSKILEKNTDGKNIKIIQKSVAFVFTHVESRITLRMIKNRLEGFLNHIPAAEGKLVKMILTQMLDSNNLIISRVATGGTALREQIEKTVTALIPQPKESFNFLAHNETQEKFNQYVIDLAKSYLLFFKDLKSISESINKLEEEKKQCEEKVKMLNTKNNGMNQTKEKNRSQLIQLEQQSAQLDQAITAKKSEIKVCEDEIAKINQKTNLTTVHTLTHNRAADPQVSVPITVRVSGKWRDIKNLPGASYDRKGYGYYNAPSTTSAPAPGSTTKELRYDFPFPTSALYQNNYNVTVTSTDTSKGYKATISYPLGYDTHIDIPIQTQERYLPPNQRAIAQQKVKIEQLESAKNLREQEKSRIETDKYKLTASCLDDKSDQEIGQNKVESENAQKQISELQKTKQGYLKNSIEILEELNQHQCTFEDVANIVTFLKLEDKNIANFVADFANYSRQMNEYLAFLETHCDNDTTILQSIRQLKSKVETNIAPATPPTKATVTPLAQSIASINTPVPTTATSPAKEALSNYKMTLIGSQFGSDSVLSLDIS